MATDYTYSLSGDFSGNLDNTQLHDEITANVTITETCNLVNADDDVVTIQFAASIAGAQQTELESVVIPAHTPLPNVITEHTDTSDPGVSDDRSAGYAICSRWINTTNNKEFVCANETIGAAVWCLTTDVNTASNIGTGGVGVFKQLNGMNLEFKKVNAGSSKLSVVDDTGNNEIDLDVVEGNLVHQNLSGAGTNTHAQIDSHLAATAAHGATGAVVGTTNTQTLSNKTLTSAVLTTPQINDTSLDHQYIFGVSELTLDRTVTLPLLTGNDTFVFEGFAQTLTNKTINTASNTLVIDTGDVTTGTFADARIAVGNVTQHEGSITHQNLSGAGTNTHAQIDSHITATAAHGATGAVVGTTNSQTLTNKTLTAPIISTISNTGTVTLPTATDTLVARGTTDTLTNKTINTASNTLVVAAGDISSGTLGVARGGTGAATLTQDGWLMGNGTGAVTAIKNNMSASVAPVGATDDVTLGYAVGSRWFDTTANKEYVCLDGTNGAAVWTETTSSGAGSTINIADEGSNIVNTPHSKLNFVGAGVSVADAGSGTATVTVSGSVTRKVAIVVDKKSSGTSGGNAQKDAWRIRTLNTLTGNAGADVALATNRITLLAGKYLITANGPAYDVEGHQIRLWNVTDSSTDATGSSGNSNSGKPSTTYSNLYYYVDLPSTKVFEIQHRFDTDGSMGVATGWGDEIYTQVIIEKLD